MSSAKQESIKHHYVPRFYLAEWAGVDGRLCVTKRLGNRILESRLAPKSTGYEERLYSFKDEPLRSNPDPDVIETKVFQGIDDNSAKAHRQLAR